MKDQSVRVEKVKNGWTVSHSWEEKDKKGEYQYESEEWVFHTKDRTLNKLKELVERM